MPVDYLVVTQAGPADTKMLKDYLALGWIYHSTTYSGAYNIVFWK